MINPFFTFGQSNCDTPSFTDEDTPECFEGSGNCRLYNFGSLTNGQCNPANDNLIVVRAYIHLVRRNNGTGAQSMSMVNSALNNMVEKFAPHGILFSFEGLDYVDDDDLYDYEHDEYPTLFARNANPDGIDIYFCGPGIYDNGRGNPPYKNHNACVIGGGTDDYNTPLPLTTILAHEVGHCFGLLHTFETACDVSGCGFTPFNCDCGDFVYDTNPESGSVCVNSNDCTYCSQNPFFPNGEPPIDNIMSYYPEVCKTRFTEGQQRRMKWFLTECSNLNRVVTNDPLKILSDLEISYSMDIPGCLTGFIVKTGGKLNISGNLNFQENASILVKTGGKLTIDAAHLAGCDDGYWKGITVQGKPSLNQIPISNQGFAELKNYTVIEKAEQPLSVGGGGIVFSRQADYYNCGVSTFYPYSRSNLSFFNSSNFILDTDFGLSELYGQVLLYGVRNLKISGCHFSATALPNSNGNKNFAIGGLSSQFQVTNNTLIEGFYTGIGSGDYGGNPLAALKVENCKFSGNFIGIDIWYGHGAIIRNNQFTGIGSHPFQPGNTSPSPHPTGLILRDCTGFIATDNVFEGASGGDPNTIGMLAWNTGSESNVIRRNTFEGLNVANQAEGTNFSEIDFTGLQYWCNSNATSNYDFFISDEGIAKEQGSGSATNNIFSHFNAVLGDYNNQSSTSINYYHRDVLVETPLTGYYFNISPFDVELEVECNDVVNDDKLTYAEEQQLMQEFDSIKMSYQTLKTTYQSLPPDSPSAPAIERQISSSKVALHRIANRILQSELADTTGIDLPKVRIWLADKESLEAAYAIVETYLYEQDTLLARQVRDSIPIKFPLTEAQAGEHYLYVLWTNTKTGWLSNGKNIFDLDSTDIVNVQYVADNSKGTAGTQAQVLLNTVYHFAYRLNPKIPGGGGSQSLLAMPSGSNGLPQPTENLFITAFPNPAKGQVTFRYSLLNENDGTELFIYDLHGKLVHNIALSDKAGNVFWDISATAPGLYHFKMRYNGGTPLSGKLVVLQ